MHRSRSALRVVDDYFCILLYNDFFVAGQTRCLVLEGVVNLAGVASPEDGSELEEAVLAREQDLGGIAVGSLGAGLGVDRLHLGRRRSDLGTAVVAGGEREGGRLGEDAGEGGGRRRRRVLGVGRRLDGSQTQERGGTQDGGVEGGVVGRHSICL